MHVGIRNTNTVTTWILNSSHQCHWCYGKNPGLLLNKYIFSLPSPCKGTYSIWNLLWSSRFWSSTAVTPIPMTFVTHLMLISLSPTPSWFVSYTVFITVSCPHLSFSVTVPFLSLGFLHMSESVKWTRMERNGYGGFCTSSMYKLVILYGGLSC